MRLSSWQIVECVPEIGEAYLLPVLAMILDQFPFFIVSFDSDNGSEYANYHVATLLEKLASSRPSLASGTVTTAPWPRAGMLAWACKHIGYDLIPQAYAKPIKVLRQEIFNSWLNRHRSRLVTTLITNLKGKTAKRELFAGFVKPKRQPDSYPRQRQPKACRAALARRTNGGAICPPEALRAEKCTSGISIPLTPEPLAKLAMRPNFSCASGWQWEWLSATFGMLFFPFRNTHTLQTVDEAPSVKGRRPYGDRLFWALRTRGEVKLDKRKSEDVAMYLA